jgi:hypothetical protein
VGIKQATGVGDVYHLRNMADFEGKYVKVAASIAVGGGAAARSMKNDKGVVINLTGVGQRVDFRLALSGWMWRLSSRTADRRTHPFRKEPSASSTGEPQDWNDRERAEHGASASPRR